MSSGALLWKDEQSVQHKFKYSPGMLAMWPGDVYHSIAPFVCRHSTDGRITMQMHVNVLEDSATVFW
jgi:glycine betaine/choline ABC-type transport system substrate-binding protein